jgi:hypothetical protein
MSAIAEQIKLEISRLDTSPSGIYLVKTDRPYDEVWDEIARSVKLYNLGPCTVIPLRLDESIESLADEKLAAFGLKRI